MSSAILRFTYMLLSPFSFESRLVVHLGVFCPERRPLLVAILSVRATAHTFTAYRSSLSNALRSRTRFFTIRVCSRFTLRVTLCHSMSCQPSATWVGAPVNDCDPMLAVAIAICFITAICFPTYNGFSNALVLKDLLEVCPLSRGTNSNLLDCLNPYPCHYSTAFAFSNILYPLSHRLVLRPSYLEGRHRAYPVPLTYQSGLGSISYADGATSAVGIA